MADTTTMRISERSHRLLRELSAKTGKTHAELIDDAIALVQHREALVSLAKVDLGDLSGPQALSHIYDAIAIRDPSVRDLFDTWEFGRVSARVFASLGTDASPTPQTKP